jgi:AcrR family transcriptional regulator
MKKAHATSRRQGRSDLTRDRLIGAAEKIFARDGFEAAKLEEIAAAAGYTRGAFYANFTSKEDLFLALLEREIAARIENVRMRIGSADAPDAKLQSLREFMHQICLDRRWALLALEFKLFAVRHSKAKAKLAAMNRRFIKSRAQIVKEVTEALGHELPASANAVGMSLSALSNALTLEHMLDRTMMPEKDVQKLMETFFNSLTGSVGP